MDGYCSSLCYLQQWINNRSIPLSNSLTIPFLLDNLAALFVSLLHYTIDYLRASLDHTNTVNVYWNFLNKTGYLHTFKRASFWVISFLILKFEVGKWISTLFPQTFTEWNQFNDTCFVKYDVLVKKQTQPQRGIKRFRMNVCSLCV